MLFFGTFSDTEGTMEMYICINILSWWLIFYIYVIVTTHTKVLDNSCTEKSY